MTDMPMEIKSVDEFLEKMKYAQKIIVVRRMPKYIKIKARTKRRLYTIKLQDEKLAEKILNQAKVEVVEY
jgi:hypothetical protein